MIRSNKEFLDYATQLRHSEFGNIIIEKRAVIGQKIIEAQTKINAMHVIVSGMAKCYLTEDTGNDFIQEFFWGGRGLWRDRIVHERH